MLIILEEFTVLRNVHKLSIINNRQLPFLQYISCGIKKSEGRIATEKVKSFKVGDILRLEGTNENALCEITFLHFYKNFKEMLINEGLKTMLPFANTVDEGVKIYSSFPGANRIKQLGCCAIGVKCIESNLKFKID